MEIEYSLHATKRRQKWGIEEHLVEEAIKRGAKQWQGKDKIVATYRYFSVVYKQRKDGTIFIITIKPTD